MISEPLKSPLSLFDVRGQSALITGASGAFGLEDSLSIGPDKLAESNVDQVEKVKKY